MRFGGQIIPRPNWVPPLRTRSTRKGLTVKLAHSWASHTRFSRAECSKKNSDGQINLQLGHNLSSIVPTCTAGGAKTTQLQSDLTKWLTAKELRSPQMRPRRRFDNPAIEQYDHTRQREARLATGAIEREVMETQLRGNLTSRPNRSSHPIDRQTARCD